MKILFVAPYVPSRIRVRPYQLIRELATRHEVSLLATDSPAAVRAAGPELREWCRDVHLAALRITERVRHCAHAALHGDPLQAAVCQSAELNYYVERWLSERQFDVVHVEHVRAARVVRGLPVTLPRLFDAVDSISLLLRRTLHGSHSLRQRVLAAIELRRTQSFEARTLASFDQTTVTAPDDERALRHLLPSANVTVIPNGVDLAYFRPLDSPPEPATIVFSGKMSYHANVTAALHLARHIFPLVRTARPTARLRILGSNPPRVIRSLAAESDAIEVTGHVADLRQGLGRATVAVCPMTVRVGIQNKVLEAMAMGVPVVASDQAVAGLRAVAGSDLIVATEPARFAAEICRLLDEPHLAHELGRAGRTFVELHHRWDVAAGALERLYAQAADTRERRTSR